MNQEVLDRDCGMKVADAAAAGVLASPDGEDDQETHVAEILSRILATRQAILDHDGPDGHSADADGCVFLTCWDFDGTILKGDCCEGFQTDEGGGYTGLLEETVRAGLSRLYQASDAGVAQARAEYDQLNHDAGAHVAYPHLALLMAGAREQEVLDLVATHFQEHQRRWLFQSSLQMMAALEAAGMETHVISASPDVYIRAIASELGWQPSHCRGIRTVVRDGVLTHELARPVTYADGKTKALAEQLVAATRRYPGKKVFVLAGFGNNHDTDGHFLRHIAAQKLPAGQPLAVMINAGPAVEEGFVHVRQDRVVPVGF